MSDDSIAIEDISMEKDDVGRSKNSPVQVPDSSPIRVRSQSTEPASSPIQITTRLPSLRERFSYTPTNTLSSRISPEPLAAPKGGLSSDLRRSFTALKNRFPHLSPATTLSALKTKGSLREAAAYLSSLPKNIQPARDTESYPKGVAKIVSPQKIVLSSSSPSKEDNDLFSSKVKLDKSGSILQRYGGQVKKDNDLIPVKKRKLVRGTRDQKPSVVTISDSEELEPVVLDDEEPEEVDDDSMEESEAEDVVDLEFDEKVLNFLNTGEKRDIVDIAGVLPSVAQILIDKRPFKSLEAIETMDFAEKESTPTTQKKKVVKKKPVGERIVETTVKKMKGYAAVDSLIKKCQTYGNSITHSIHKWGAEVHNNKGELEIVEIDMKSEQSDDNNSDKTLFSNENSQAKNESYEAFTSDDDMEDREFTLKMTRTSTRPRGRPPVVKVDYFKSKPKLMADDFEMKNYQIVGMNWLNLLYQKRLSCILADEMGLGKTLQVVAFLTFLKQQSLEGPHLVIVPSSTLENWLREFQKFSPSLKVVPYYGSQNARAELREELMYNNDYDVLVTTYTLATGHKYDQSFLRSRNFNVIVYDEGHMLKNSNSDRYTKLMKLGARFRLLLTGTPLQNNLRELISLLAFILPGIFNEKREDLLVLFDQKASTKSTHKRETEEDAEDEEDNYNPLLSQQAITNARAMMAPFVLRRKKDQVMQHLPAKHHFTEYCELDEYQKTVYQEEIQKARDSKAERERRKLLSPEELKKLPKSEVPLSSSNVVMQLRKAALHPLLFRTHYKDSKLRKMSGDIMKSDDYYNANREYIFEDMQVMSDFELNRLCHTYAKQLAAYQLDSESYYESGKVKKMLELIDQVIKKGEKVLVFSLFTQVLDILEMVLSLNHIKFLRLDGQTAVDERQAIIDKFYDAEEVPVMLLSTKAGGFGINLVCANNVIIFDQSFNPHDDKQAEDRAHRVGQTKEVNVYRIICRDTIEENILQLAQNKLQLDDSMMSSSEDKVAKTVESMILS
ncbi:hypothetical protein OGAPHI_003460 [Ogataea philodendri]|uniref:DNA helicase n=1 Tax=Ogataea philodendri TaxID=1378263 RepID=A0A9P8P866_9ASCO|nr:uncharacterized protein OGAPHI_003460 [Ogataea philodendri]KAH3666464.1 hypothetical protein OGAPHI_003460 [Ogataea philodendri]